MVLDAGGTTHIHWGGLTCGLHAIHGSGRCQVVLSGTGILHSILIHHPTSRGSPGISRLVVLVDVMWQLLCGYVLGRVPLRGIVAGIVG